MLKLNAPKSSVTQAVTLLTTIAFLVCTQGAAMGQRMPTPTKGGANVSAPPVDVLPQVRNLMQGVGSLEKLKGGSSLATLPKAGGDVEAFNSLPGADKLVIHQNEAQAILDWKSFNIGKEAWTHFDQQGRPDWTALNRIYDQNPSLIFGRLTADGRVFLINQNGILFGPDSRVNVPHLTASTLNIRDEDFLSGRLKFKAENYQAAGDPVNPNVFVTNEGTIETGSLGSVFLLGQNVENAGVINAPVGQIGLAAGHEVEIGPDTNVNTTRTALVVNVKQTAGEAANLESGRITTDSGLAGMCGRVVNQDGIIRAVTAVKKAGRIELYASERIRTGPNSVTETPVTASDEKVNESFPYRGGEISLRGLDPVNPLYPQVQVERIEHRGVIEAPSGVVTMEAKERVFLENGSRIDVSGAWVNLPASALQIDAQLNSVNLRDDFMQKNGILKGKTVSVNALYGSSIGDISGYLASQDKTALERSTTGGEVFISARGGDIVLKEDALIDFSGGGIRYAAGRVETTQLISGGRVYDISVAPQYLNYSPQSRALDYYNELYARHGLSSGLAGLAGKLYFGMQSVGQALGSFVEGADAGALTLISRQMVLDGRLDGSVTRGPFQNQTAELVSAAGNQMTRGRKAPAAGSLILGDRPATASPELRDLVIERVVVRQSEALLPESFGPLDVVPQRNEQTGTLLTTLSAARINSWGLGQLQVFSNTSIEVEPGARIALSPGGSVSLVGRRIEHRGEVDVPSGAIRFELVDNVTSLPSIQGTANPRFIAVNSRIFLDGGSRLNAAGQTANLALGNGSNPLVLVKGGDVVLSDRTSAGDGVMAKRGALVDVSGGWKIDSKGKLSSGSAGSLSVFGRTVAFDAEARGHALSGSTGGKISLHASSISVMATAPSLPDDFQANSRVPEVFEDRLLLDGGRFETYGFTRFELTAADDIFMDIGSKIFPSPWKIAEPLSTRELSASAVKMQVRLMRVPDAQIGSSSFKFRAGEPLPGENLDGSPRERNINATIAMDRDSSIRSGPGGTISFDAPRLRIAGAALAPAGEIGLRSRQDDVWLQNGALLSAAATNVPRLAPVMAGYPAGFNVLNAGRVAIDSSRDIVVEAGVLIDVSGSAPAVDYMPVSYTHLTLPTIYSV